MARATTAFTISSLPQSDKVVSTCIEGLLLLDRHVDNSMEMIVAYAFIHSSSPCTESLRFHHCLIIYTRRSRIDRRCAVPCTPRHMTMNAIRAMLFLPPPSCPLQRQQKGLTPPVLAVPNPYHFEDLIEIHPGSVHVCLQLLRTFKAGPHCIFYSASAHLRLTVTKQGFYHSETQAASSLSQSPSKFGSP